MTTTRPRLGSALPTARLCGRCTRGPSHRARAARRLLSHLPARASAGVEVDLMGNVGLMLEDHLSEIASTWRVAVAEVLTDVSDPALGTVVPLYLRELARVLGGRAAPPDGRGDDPWARVELLLRLTPREGPSGVAVQLKLLREAIWEVLKRHGRLVTTEERLALDRRLDEAFVGMVTRLCDAERQREAWRRAAVEAARQPSRPLPAPARAPLPVAARRGEHALPPPAPRVPLRSAAEARALAEVSSRTIATGPSPRPGARPPPLPKKRRAF